MQIKKVGVVGCGQMGGGIVQVCARAGYPVVVSEVNKDLLAKGLGAIATALEKLAQRAKITAEEKTMIISRIIGTIDFAGFKECDLVIEAAAENMDVKKKIFQDLDKACHGEAILATNTSCLSVTEIGQATKRPDKALGMHFFNPAPVMKLIEVAKTAATSQATADTAAAFGKSLGKTVVMVQDSPGFIVNRLMTPQILNAVRVMESGAATKEDIDTAMTLGLNDPIGPLALADLIGLDVLLSIADGIYDKLKDEQYKAPELLRKMAAAGNLGRKTGRGFYEYH